MFLAPLGPDTLNARILGHSDGSSAPGGEVGEYVTGNAAAAAVGLTSATPALVCSASISAGEWDCYGDFNLTFAGGTSYTAIQASVAVNTGLAPAIGLPVSVMTPGGATLTQGVSGVIVTGPTAFQLFAPATVPGVSLMSFPVPMCRIFVPKGCSPFPIGLAVQCTFTLGTLSAGGNIRCRRVR